MKRFNLLAAALISLTTSFSHAVEPLATDPVTTIGGDLIEKIAPKGTVNVTVRVRVQQLRNVVPISPTLSVRLEAPYNEYLILDLIKFQDNTFGYQLSGTTLPRAFPEQYTFVASVIKQRSGTRFQDENGRILTKQVEGSIFACVPQLDPANPRETILIEIDAR